MQNTIEPICNSCHRSIWETECGISHRWRKVEIANAIRRNAGMSVKAYPVPETFPNDDPSEVEFC